MYTGTSESSNQGGGYSPKTGIAAFNLLGVNPTADQIKAWTGRETVAEPSYDLTQDLNQNTVRPVHVWVHSPAADVTTRFIINVGNNPAVTKNGNHQIIASNGSVTYAKDKFGVVKEEFANHKPLVIGEAELIAFIQKLINFKTSSGEDFYKQMVALKQDAASLYAGNYAGLNNLAKWATENNKMIVSVLTVRKKDAAQPDGSVVAKTYQSFCENSRVWFHCGETLDWTESGFDLVEGVLKAKNTKVGWYKQAIKTNYEESLVVKAGATQAYPIIKDLFTYDLQNFKEEDCVNYVPANPTGGWN